MDINTLKYKITDFDENNRVIFVEFDETSQTAIQLPLPIPTTKEEIDYIVKQYAPTLEFLESVNQPIPSNDLSFVKSLVSKKKVYKTERRSLVKENKPLDSKDRGFGENGFPVVPPLSDMGLEQDRDYIKALVREELLALGVLTNEAT